MGDRGRNWKCECPKQNVKSDVGAADEVALFEETRRPVAVPSSN
ncbi:MAG: hypothetical protein Athens041674_318 [Parcubacteria group bacterium Athens0416_74]|nr:MAG: hypothetical protein Athens041674_318 [Parcubacteria group bacterium Athens0416_74]